MGMRASTTIKILPFFPPVGANKDIGLTVTESSTLSGNSLVFIGDLCVWVTHNRRCRKSITRRLKDGNLKGIAAVSILIPMGFSQRVEFTYEELLGIPNLGVSDSARCSCIRTSDSHLGGAGSGCDPRVSAGSSCGDAISAG